MHHANEHPRHRRAEHWRVRRTRRKLVGRHARPGELRVALVVDLRVFDADARALGEAMVVA